MVFQGFRVALQAPPGQRRFLELAFSEFDGVSFALYDTQGMAIDLRNHICPVLHHRHLDAETDLPRLLAEHGVAMKATSNGSPARLVFHEHGCSVFEENGEKLAADIVLEPGPASVRVGRACPMEGLFEWTDVQDLLRGVTVRAQPLPAPGLKAPAE